MGLAGNAAEVICIASHSAQTACRITGLDCLICFADNAAVFYRVIRADDVARGITALNLATCPAHNAADTVALPHASRRTLNRAADHRAVFQRLDKALGKLTVSADHRADLGPCPNLRILNHNVFELRLVLVVRAAHITEKPLIALSSPVDFQPRDDVVLPVENAHKRLILRADRRPVAVCGQVHVIRHHIMRRDERPIPRVDILRQLGQLRGAGNLERRVRPAHRQQGNASLALLHDIQILRLFFERQRGLILNRLGPFKIRLRIAFR